MSNKTWNHLGTFEIESGTIRFSDPCYDKGTWCTALLHNAKRGMWEAYACIADEGEWGERVAILAARHASQNLPVEVIGHEGRYLPHHFSEVAGTIGVDSGQCGIFDDKYFRDNSVVKDYDPKADYGEDWYNVCCDITLAKEQAGVLPYGCVSSSGYGDGTYPAIYHADENMLTDIVAIYFILEDENEDEEDEYDINYEEEDE